MASSGRNACPPANAITAEGGSGSARQARADDRAHQTAMRVIALAGLAHVLRSRRFYVQVITMAIGVAAAKRIGQENQSSAMARLAAWDKRQVERFERKAKAQGRSVKGSARLARSGATRHLGANKDRA